MIRVLIADDHPIVRKGLTELVAGEPDMTVTAESGNGLEVLRLIETERFDVVLLDISMPGMSGLEILQKIRPEHPNLPILVLSGFPETELAMRTLKAGASGYLNKEMAPEELVAAIRLVHSGRKYVSPAVAELLANSVNRASETPHDSLSDREYQVMLLLAAGKTVSEIASEISLSVKTVSTYRARILEKMDLKNNAELMLYAIRNNLAARV
jgi:DNA-binding NarL/FixJ family response regulator